MTTTPTFVESTDGVRVALHDLGGDGPPLLLAHATGFCGRVWEPVAAALADRFHCWAPDLRGHGDAVTPDDHAMSWHGFSADVLAVLDHLATIGSGVDVAAGHSKGGASLILAEQERPGTFRALYCYEPVVFPRDMTPPARVGPRSNFLADGARKRRDRFPDRAEAMANYSSKPPLSVLDPAALAAYVDNGFAQQADGSLVLKCRPESEARTYEMGGQHRAYDHLPEVTAEVTIAAGDRDADQGPGLMAPEVAERLPRGHLTIETGLGHLGPLEDPPRIAEDIATALT